MGTLTWSEVSAYSSGHFSVEGLPCGSDKGLCSKYTPGSYSSQDKVFTLIRNNTTGLYALGISDSSYTDAATFKTAMSGVILYYELAEPVEYDLMTPIGDSYKVISGGTEERLPRDTASSVMAPIKYSVKYVQPKE